MLGFGTSEAIVMPVDDHHSVTPKSLLHGERAATVAQVLAIGLAPSIADLLTTWIANGLNDGLLPELGTSLVFGLTFSLAFGLASGVNSPWLRYLSAHGWLALRGQLPWHLMRFLDDAYRRVCFARSAQDFGLLGDVGFFAGLDARLPAALPQHDRM
jgi:hypothetical protein